MIKSKIYLFSNTPSSEVNHIPILEVNHINNSIDFSSFDYIIATSKETIIGLEKIGGLNLIPVLAISQSTADFALSKGCKILDIADGYGKGVVELIKTKYSELKKPIHPHAKIVAYDIDGELIKIGVDIYSFIIYETYCSKKEKHKLPNDAICIFTSPSSVNCFLKKYEFLSSYKIVCIGTTTALSLPTGINYTLSENTTIESTIQKAKNLL